MQSWNLKWESALQMMVGPGRTTTRGRRRVLGYSHELHRHDGPQREGFVEHPLTLAELST